MLSKEECIKLLGFLEKGELQQMEEYLKEQYDIVYISEALEALKKYCKLNYPNYRYKLLPDNQLLLRGQGIYFLLYSRELYDEYSKSKCEPLEDITNGKEVGYLEKLRNDDYGESSTVILKELEPDPEEAHKEVYRMSSVDDTISACFKKDVIDFAELILGSEPGYHLRKDENGKPVLLAQSLKGRAYIMCKQ